MTDVPLEGSGTKPPHQDEQLIQDGQLIEEARLQPCADPPPSSDLEKEPEYFLSLRFGRIRQRGTFTTKDVAIKEGDWVMAHTPRGVELGLVLSPLRTVPRPAGLEGEDEAELVGEILHIIPDSEEVVPPWHQSGRFSQEFDTACRMSAELDLPMKLTDVEVLPRRDKAIFYFLADGRIDFRQLVRNLARALRLRVEMKQIGVRDEARLKGTCGHCGLPLCCSAWIRRMAPVNMRMAKAQKTTLDPDKISGRCGRLLCCLRYEEGVYAQHRKLMPNKNCPVHTPDGPGRVCNQEILTCQVRVALEGGERKVYPLSEIKILGPGQPNDDFDEPDSPSTPPPEQKAQDHLPEEPISPEPKRRKRRRKKRPPS